MNWFLIALLPPLFWSGTNIIDQFIIRRYFPNKTASCIFFSAIANSVYSFLIFLFRPEVISVPIIQGITISFIGLICTFMFFPYLKALEMNDASRSLPAFQLIPVFTVLLELLFFGRMMEMSDMVAGIIIVVGAIIVSWEFSGKRFNIKPFMLIVFSAFLFALYAVLIDIFAAELPWYTVTFWVVCGWAMSGVIYLSFSKDFRKTVVGVIKESKGKVFFFDFLQQGCDVAAHALFIAALAVAPSAAHVMLVDGLHPLYILIVSGILGYFVPRYYERLCINRYLIIRLSGGLVIIFGLYILLFV